MLRPPHRRSRAALDRMHQGGSMRTIVVALVANVVIAAAKLAAGLISGSSALLAEAAHSFADASNEVLLGISLRRAGAPADDLHPLGHGRERFLWAFLAALASFLIGGCFSVGMAVRQLIVREQLGNPFWAWIVLGIAFVGDGISWLQSVRQARADSKQRGMSFIAYLRRSSDPTVRAVFAEDGAALIGLLIAAGGLLFSGLFSSNHPDAIASMLIGVLMAATALWLGRNLADFLVGKSLPEGLVEEIRQIVASHAGVAEVVSLQAVYIGPEEVIVAAKVRPAPGFSAEELGREMDDVDQALRKASPFVADVYIDLTSHRSSDGDDHA